MRHVDPDLLALLALGETVGSLHDLEHVASCEVCGSEVENLSRAARIARSTIDEGPLLEPADRVWTRIASELGSAPVPRPSHSAAGRPVAEFRPRRRWVAPIAVAASLALLAGGIGVAATIMRPEQATVLASAELQAFPGWSGSTGEALAEQEPGGGRVIKVLLNTPSDEDGYREVWLITSDATKLVSLGIIRGDSGTFTVPDGIDLTSYDLVDVSAEAYDGDPAHSGDSILRGTLS